MIIGFRLKSEKQINGRKTVSIRKYLSGCLGSRLIWEALILPTGKSPLGAHSVVDQTPRH
jgi:hypothetical protein